MRVLLSVFISLCLCQMALARDIVVSIVSELSTTRAAAGDIIHLQGYLNPGDGGDQTLYYSTAGGTADGGFIFDAPGAGNERFIAIKKDIADPAKFGAVAGATSTQVADAFQAAINSGVPVINRDASKTWTIDDGLTNPLAIPMEIYGKIISTMITEPVVAIGQNTVETFCTNRVFRLNVSRSNLVNYATSNLTARAKSTGNVTVSNPGTAVFDGVTLVSTELLLLNDQTTASQNGLYVFNGSGSALTRATTMDAWGEVVASHVTVSEGTANAGSVWLNYNVAGGTLGTTSITFTGSADGVTITNCIDGQWHLTAGNCLHGIVIRGDDGTAAGNPKLGACSRNQIWLGLLNENLTGVKMEANGEGGYCNENTFYGGEIDTTSSMNTATELKGFHLEHTGTTDQHYLDGNRIIGPSLEMHNQHATALKHVFYASFTAGVMAAHNNRFSDFRMEGGTGGSTDTINYRIVGGKGWVDNTFRSNFLQATDNLCAGVTTGDGQRVQNAANNQFYLRHEDQHYYKLTEINPRQMVVTASGVTAPPHGTLISGLEGFNQVASGFDVTETEISTSSSMRAVVIPIDLTDSFGDETDKTLIVYPIIASGGGRVVVRCYAADGTTVLEGADDCSIGAYAGGGTLAFTSSLFTADGQGSGRPYMFKIGFSPAVKFALVGFGQVGVGGDDDVHMKCFQIFAKQKSGARILRDDTAIALMSGNTRYPIFEDSDMPRSNVAPTSTYHIHGTLVRNTSESELGAGVPVFWRFDAAEGVWDEVGP